jgi:hypothetical protein
MALAFLALRRFTPPALQVCPFHWLTGWPCPLCGLTRAMFELAKGHWRAAVGFNALSPLAVAMLLTLFWNIPGRSRLWNTGLAAFAIYGVCRVLFPSLAGTL